MVPGFRFQGTAARFVAFAVEKAEQSLFHHHHREQHNEGKGRRHFMRGNDVDDAFVGNDACRSEEEGNGDEGGERFRPPVAVGMVGVGRATGEAQAEIEQQRRKDIGGGLDSVRNQRVRITENPCRALDKGKDGVAEHAEQYQSGGGRAHRPAPHIAVTIKPPEKRRAV